MMRDHYDNNFKLDILGSKSVSEKDKAVGIKVAKQADEKVQTKDGDIAEAGDPTIQQESGTSKPLTSLLSAFFEEMT